MLVEVVVMVSVSMHVSGQEWELELSGPHRMAATSSAILDIALGKRPDILLTACEDIVVTISSIFETAV